MFGDSDDRNSVGIALTFLFIGLGIGALSALLFAPSSGKQMRKNLRRKYEGAREALDEWTDQASDMIDRGSDIANKVRDRGRDWAGKAAEKARDRVAPVTRALNRD
ncbi:MAG TPA: YtxH domain-containing protein [Terriglobales bacterium]|nr:YtxH domain-containing protein [Terriglobales bacterium]